MNDVSVQPVPSDNDIYANPPDVTTLDLEPGHPGLGDAAYIARRQELFALCRRTPAGESRPAADCLH